MPVTSRLYGQALVHLFNKRIDFDTDAVKAMLVGSGYTPNQDTHDYKDDIGANEASGSGYTARGQALASRTVVYDAATNKLTLDCADVVWNPSTLTARYAVFYVDTGSDATSPLIAYWDFGEVLSTNGTEFKLTIPATGLITFTVT